MTATAVTYAHQSVYGLPASLLVPEGSTVAVIALMQRQAGLTRERRRRDLNGRQRVEGDVSASAIRAAPKDDKDLLSHYLSAEQRYRSFWRVAELKQDPQGRRGLAAFAMAIDIQLIDAYEPDWLKLPLDAEVLTEACPQWPRIQSAIEPIWKGAKGRMPLGVFMLWLRLLDDMRRWEDLDTNQRLRAGRAVFALSSIGRTQWFVEEALKRCPGLEPELGALRRLEVQGAGSARKTAEQESCPANAGSAALADRDVAKGPCIDCDATWASVGEELARVKAAWEAGPSRALAARLAVLGRQADELASAMPVDSPPPRELLEQGLESLRTRMLEAASGDDLAWLGGDDLEGIMARWRLALAGAQNDEAVVELVDDTQHALDRLTVAISEVQTAKARVVEARQIIADLDEQLPRQASVIRRIELAKRRQQAKEDELAAERKQTDVMLFVLASASPMGEAFDPEANYPAELAARSEGTAVPDKAPPADEMSARTDDVVPAAVEPVVAAPTVEALPPKTAIADEPMVVGLAVASNPVPVSVEPATVASEPTPDVVAQASPDDLVAADSTAMPQMPLPVASDTGFNDKAGDECRPIWSLLCLEKPALAFQFARALQEASPGLTVPHPALLRAVALAPGLVASDGPLAMTVGEGFADIEASWFEPGDSPSNWHTALNLLLIAATLRPMVLAPATGAAAIARYRHLDGRHAALLELVRKVGRLSEPLTGFAVGPAVLRSAADEATQKAQLVKLSKNAEDWLYERAPSKKIRYVPASKVWLHWLKPGETIHRLVSPVARGAMDERNAVRTAIEELSRYDVFMDRLCEYRRQSPRRGQDIEAGALEHLWVLTCEAVALAKEWLATASMQSDSGGRLRLLVGQLQAAFNAHAEAACVELDMRWDGDDWGQVEAASIVLRSEIRAITGMFKQSDAVPTAEPQTKELLARDLLWVPGTLVGPGWSVESSGQALLQALGAWSNSPIDTSAAFDARIKAGDLAGAEVLLSNLSDDNGDGRVLLIEKTRDQWGKDLDRLIKKARSASEVGLAYGYLIDDEWAACESELSAVELSQHDTMRFDAAARRVQAVMSRIEAHKSREVDEARQVFEREKSGLAEDVARQIEAPLARYDIHTFYELLQRVRQGAQPWPERELRRDVFREFYPTLRAELSSQLAKLSPARMVEVDRLIHSGGTIGPVSFDLDGDDQARADAEQTFRAWAVLKSGKPSGTQAPLRKILEALGLPLRTMGQAPGALDSSKWMVTTSPIDDGEVCPVPHFGSRAQGRYRVIVSKKKSTKELLAEIGADSLQTATIVLSLESIGPRDWPELAKASKLDQRSFLLLDESMLLFLLAQRGSRLATWFSIALPLTYSEPYDASAGFVPSEMFYGRASELESVKAQGGCYFIYGGRQLGKTALLRRAEKTFHDASADRYAVWIDTLAQGIGERRPAVDVWLAVADKLRELRIVGLELPPVNPAKPASIDAFLASIKSFLAAKLGRRILLLLDEADRFFEQDGRQESAYAETRRLKQLMDETERRFKVVFAGLHNVLRTASTSNQPLGHLNEAVRIGPLIDEREIRAAEQLITRPIEAAGFEFGDRSIVMRILAQTNYYPSLIQLYCTQLLRQLRETKLSKISAGPRFKIEEADIESVFSGRPLRDAIRSKFRLTLQLDDRYEVIANAIGLEAMVPGFDHAQGIEWRAIWNDCRASWWPEGFAKTTERDFLVLLEEMVQLGVLSQAKTPERFSLRNPNVLLLLGSKQEIEDTLQAEREPRIEFESTIFRPALGGRVDQPARNPLTYRQLDEVVQMRSSVLLVAACEAAGARNLLPGLLDQPGSANNRLFVVLDRPSDKRSFTQELDKEIKRRVADGITVMLVPASVPWDADWVTAAKAKLGALRSTTSFVSVVFAADPQRLWVLAAAVPERAAWVEPWLSVLPWERGFVRKWLEELQFPPDAVERLQVLTGYWGGLLEAAVPLKGGALDFAANLERMAKQVEDPAWRQETLHRLTGGVAEAERVLAAMVGLGNGVTEGDLVEFADLPRVMVDRTLRWAEPLGLVAMEAGSGWTLDPFVKHMLGDAGT